MDINTTTRIVAPFGVVDHIEHPSPDDPTLTARSRAALSCSVATWLITAPAYHPVWSQYVLSTMRLIEHPDLPPPYLKFVGATHEMILFAIEPGKGPGHGGAQTVESMREHCRTGKVPMLTPVNIAEQFICTDDEVRTVAWLAARAVALGRLNPETGDAPTRIRGEWLAACTKTLAHIRGEAHA